MLFHSDEVLTVDGISHFLMSAPASTKRKNRLKDPFLANHDRGVLFFSSSRFSGKPADINSISISSM